MTIDGIPGPNVFTQRDVRRTPQSTQTQSQTIVAPIGAVLAWLKSFTNTPQTLPTGFVECNGQVLSDGDSVYDGQTLPDLNGDNQFLRGNSTSGGTGGTATHSHTFAESFDNHLGVTAGSNFNVIDVDGWGGPQSNDSSGTLPPFYNMVWIMRIK